MIRRSLHRWVLAIAIIVTAVAYWPGLSGGFLFDDYPNIVDNHGVQPAHADLASLMNAALSSPASEFKRPLASLSFALNYLASGGLNPYSMKLTNLVIHLLNGLLVFLLARGLLRSACIRVGTRSRAIPFDTSEQEPEPTKSIAHEQAPTTTYAWAGEAQRVSVTAALIAAAWMLLPINLTGVLYVVQRMESMANLFVLLGLIGYVAGRRHMLESIADATNALIPSLAHRGKSGWGGFWLCVISITVPAAVGILAKETAAMLPLYALLIEWALFGFRTTAGPRDRRLIALFLLVLVLPLIGGLTWLLPNVLNHADWATRDFTLDTRLLSEARIVVDYIVWTLLPVPHDLSFYHDNFHTSTGLLSPWTTLVCMLTLTSLAAFAVWLRPRRPLVALGIALFLGCQLLTGTILPLELVYEHRNYFASFGLMLALVPLLAAFASNATSASFALPRRILLGGLLLLWTGETAMSAMAWGNPLLLAETLAARAPDSPRAEYELGRTYIIYSHYDPASPFTKLAYAPLERAAALPDASILPEQALIFMNSRMHLPLKDAWWDSLIGKLKAHKPGVQDESSLSALTQCDREHNCNLPTSRMIAAYLAALSHPNPSARLLAMYGDFAWNVLADHDLGLRMTKQAVTTSPNEPAYQITLIRMLIVQGHVHQAAQALQRLQELNTGGRLNNDLDGLRKLLIARPLIPVEAAPHAQPLSS
ncbi:hypothetical protein [Rhodanobacter glycinis]|uniref:Tetratricopeptide repeat protein n=1 Tax=Rhodanobacter glycinis TaxID=582702 RepID=A0A1I4BFE8_9GAMM|nr:hypothetical protein [Rhodanobacter glycinis]SFK67592.1 hypothetical protein SAMN05192579_10583 [Rhodanobacter glycinis]